MVYLIIGKSKNTLMALLILALFISLVVFISYITHRLDDFPPGPPHLPFIGSVLSIPKEQEWRLYAAWKRVYGSIVGMRVMGQNIVIINTTELVNELFINRGAKYGERPIVPMLDLMDLHDWNIGLLRRGDLHTLTRKMMAQSLSEKTMERHEEIQQEEVQRMLVTLLESPEKFYYHLRSVNVKMIMRVFYGLKINDGDDFVKLNDEAIAVSTDAAAPTGYLVNTFPLLLYLPSFFPGTNFREAATRGQKLFSRLFNFPVEVLKQKIDNGEAQPSFLSPYLQDSDKTREDLYAAQAVAGTAYSAGVETSTSVLLTLVLAMLRYPNVQRKAQDEIDRNIPGRLPSSFDDLENLPYVRAVVMECYRWATPAPLGLPRQLMQDDYVMGYRLPKGTIVLPNSWAILRDEEVYPKAEEFIPERFLGDSSQPDPREHVFGYGRRACPGRYLADHFIWLSIANILAAFKISPLLDASGHPIIPPYEFTTGIMSRPKDFECSISPRSDRIVQLIRANYVS